LDPDPGDVNGTPIAFATSNDIPPTFVWCYY